MCKLEPGAYVTHAKLYQAYSRWLITKGHMSIPPTESFAKDLHAALPGLTSKQKRVKDGKQQQCHFGIMLLPQGPRPTRKRKSS